MYDTATIKGAAQQRGYDRGYTARRGSAIQNPHPHAIAGAAQQAGRKLYPDDSDLAGAFAAAFIAGVKAAAAEMRS